MLIATDSSMQLQASILSTCCTSASYPLTRQHAENIPARASKMSSRLAITSPMPPRILITSSDWSRAGTQQGASHVLAGTCLPQQQRVPDLLKVCHVGAVTHAQSGRASCLPHPPPPPLVILHSPTDTQGYLSPLIAPPPSPAAPP
jgi:hypothetical protein